MKYLIFIGCMIFGYVGIAYSKWLVDSLGRISFFETKIGGGGTYTFWKLLGVALIIFGIAYIFS